MTLRNAYDKILKDIGMQKSIEGKTLPCTKLFFNEVNAVDKYEYKSKTDRMLELMESGAYSRAAEIADEIDWRRVRNAGMLSNVSEIYEKNGEYQKGYDTLTLAYQRAEGSRKIISRLCGLALKTGNVDEAIDFYDDFMQIAPKDPNQYILRYKILRAQRAPIEQQIEALEEYKKSEYIEEWAYELAKLYQEAGMIAECLEECDDLILWFSEGQYVYKAMELKMQYKPLTPSQKEKYDRRYERVSEETEEIPDIFSYADADETASEEEDVQIREEEPEGKGEDQSLAEQERPRVPRGMEELVPEMMPETSPEGESALAPESRPVEVNTEAWDAEDIVEAEETLMEQVQDEDADLASETMQETESEEAKDIAEAGDFAEADAAEAENADRSEEIDQTEGTDEAEAEKGLDVLETTAEQEEERHSAKKKLGDTMPLDVALRKLLHPELEELTADDFQDETAPMDFHFEKGDAEDEESEFDLTETGAMDFDFEEEEDEETEFDLTETGAMDFDFEEEEDEETEFDLTATGAMDLDFDFSDEEDAGYSGNSDLGNTSQIKFRPERKDEIDGEEDLADLEQAIGEIESVADIGMVSRIKEEKRRAAEEAAKAEAEAKAAEEAAKAEAEAKAAEDAMKEDDQITGQISLEDILSEFEGNTEEEPVKEGADAENASEVKQEDMADSTGDIIKGDTMETNKKTTPILPPDIQRMIDEIEGVIPPEEEKKEVTGVRLKRKEEPSENMGQVAEDLKMDDEFVDDFDEDYDEDYYEEAEEVIDEAEDEDYYEEAEEVIDEADEDYYEEAEEVIDEADEDYYEEAEEVIDEADEDYYEEAEEVIDEAEEDYYEEAEEVIDEAEEDYYEEAEEVIDEAEEDYYEEAEEAIDEVDGGIEIEDEYFFGEDDAEEIQDIEEEFQVNPEYSDEEDDREIPDDDEPIDIMSATTPLSRKETAKLIATGKTAPIPLDEISDALSMDTGFVVHGRYDLETQSGIGTRAGLTEEQKKLFSYFVPVRGMSEQLVDVLEQDKNCTNRKGTSRTGNLLIIGNKGNGKTVLAVDVVKAIQKQRNIRQGKVAIVTGESLNKKKIGDIVDKLYGGALIIEKASKMNEKTVARLNKAMEQDTGEMLIVLEEQRKPLDRLLSSNREFRKKFTSRLEVPIFINDELVTFGQTYAKENGYHIDEMGILALYSKIDSLQREDHFVTVAEVKEVMDDAIRHSQKASAKKLMRRVFGRNTDESDRIILSEKDFNV